MRGRGYFFWWTLPIANWHPRLSTSASFVAVHNESQIAICADALAFLRRSDPRQRERRGKPSDVMTQKTTACSRCCSKRRQNDRVQALGGHDLNTNNAKHGSLSPKSATNTLFSTRNVCFIRHLVLFVPLLHSRSPSALLSLEGLHLLCPWFSVKCCGNPTPLATLSTVAYMVSCCFNWCVMTTPRLPPIHPHK